MSAPGCQAVPVQLTPQSQIGEQPAGFEQPVPEAQNRFDRLPVRMAAAIGKLEGALAYRGAPFCSQYVSCSRDWLPESGNSMHST
jgi:hypothetical protein